MNEITLVRFIEARPSIVFDALSSAEGMTSWWGPTGSRVLNAEADVRVGGAFRVRFRTSDGLEHECAGAFIEIVEPERIVMSWQWASGGEPSEAGSISRVELHLRAFDEGTLLTLVHAGLSDEISARHHDQGWYGALTKLAGNFSQTPSKTVTTNT